MEHKEHTIDLSTSPRTRQLHVVVRGLICVRMSERSRTVMLHIPDVNMKNMGHVYLAGTYRDLRRIPPSVHDFHLDCVEAGDFVPNPCQLKDQFVAVSAAELEQKYSFRFHPHGTRNTVRLPWPSDYQRVRLLKEGQKAQYSYAKGKGTINPPECGYLAFLTYNLSHSDQPVLYKGCEKFWFSEALGAHTILHFMADPPRALTEKQWEDHTRMAYAEGGEQLFQPDLDLVAEPPRPTWQDPDATAPIPVDEQCDPTTPFDVEHGEMHALGEFGNCLPFHVLD